MGCPGCEYSPLRDSLEDRGKMGGAGFRGVLRRWRLILVCLRGRVIHRADYHQVMLDKAREVGVQIRLGVDVVDLDFDKTCVILAGAERVEGDVIIGADGISLPQIRFPQHIFSPVLTLRLGLWSLSRDKLLSHPSPPLETGDLAYRGTFTHAQLLSLNEPRISELCERKVVTVWFGPDRHAVFYPVRAGREFNLVLLRPDDLPGDVRTGEGGLEEMRDSFAGWDEM